MPGYTQPSNRATSLLVPQRHATNSWQTYNLDETIEVTEEEGMRWHLVQTLAGDQLTVTVECQVLVLNVPLLCLTKKATRGTQLSRRSSPKIDEEAKRGTSHRNLTILTMKSTNESYHGFPPPPVMELTIEQSFS